MSGPNEPDDDSVFEHTQPSIEAPLEDVPPGQAPLEDDPTGDARAPLFETDSGPSFLGEDSADEDTASGDDSPAPDSDDDAPDEDTLVGSSAGLIDAASEHRSGESEFELELVGDGEEGEGFPLPGGDHPGGPGLERAGLAPPPDPARLKSILESLIFVAEKPLTEKQLATAARASLGEIRPLLIELTNDYEQRGISLDLVAGGYQFRSAARNAAFVRELVAAKPVRLSRPQIETLAIVAYRQPVTRPEVDDIRGVDSGYALNALGERQLIKVVGRKEEAGRPLLYGTTAYFLEFFGLNNLSDLPTLKEFSDLSEESRALFERRMGEPLDLASVEAQSKAAVEEATDREFTDESDDDGAPEQVSEEPREDGDDEPDARGGDAEVGDDHHAEDDEADARGGDAEVDSGDDDSTTTTTTTRRRRRRR